MKEISIRDIAINNYTLRRLSFVEGDKRYFEYVLGNIVNDEPIKLNLYRYGTNKVFVPLTHFQHKAIVSQERFDDIGSFYYVVKINKKTKVYRGWISFNKAIINYYEQYIQDHENT